VGQVNFLLVPRTLAAGTAVGTVTSLRIGRSCASLLARRVPSLTTLGLQSTAGDSAAQAKFRDELLALARDSAETSWRQVRRGLDQLDALTRAADQLPQGTRPYRVKP
jgi:hypothetical protein